MLVVSQNIVLSEPEDVPAGTPRILYDNRVVFGNVTATSSVVDHPVTNVADVTTAVYWLATAATQQEIAVAVNAVDEIDAVGIAGHNFGAAQIAVSVGYYDESDAWQELVQAQIPPDDQPMLLQFTPQSLASVVIRMAAGGAAPRVAVAYAGKLLVCERGVVPDAEMPLLTHAQRTTRANGVSDSGTYLGSIVLGARLEWSAVFKWFRPDWYRTNFAPFVRAAQSERPFFYAWKPDAYPYEVAYAWLLDDPIPMVDPITLRIGVELRASGIVS